MTTDANLVGVHGLKIRVDFFIVCTRKNLEIHSIRTPKMEMEASCQSPQVTTTSFHLGASYRHSIRRITVVRTSSAVRL